MLSRARAVYRETQKPVDIFWNKYVARPPAAFVVALLERTSATPNQVTLLSFLIGVVSAALMIFLPGWAGLLLATIVFEIAYIFDCVDGMLARAKRISSPQGHFLDFLMDELKALLFFGAVSVRLYLDTNDARFLILGVVGEVALASGLSLTTFLRRPEISGPSRPGPARARLTPLGLVEAAAKFLVHYPSYVLYLAIANRIDLYFYAYLGVNLLYYARTWLWVARKAISAGHWAGTSAAPSQPPGEADHD